MPYSTRAVHLFLPLALFSASLIASQYISELNSIWQTLLLQSLPVISIGIALLLSLQFNRSRFSIALLLCSISAYLFNHDSYFSYDEKLCINSVLMLNLLLLSFSKDRNLLSVHGVLRLGIIVVEAIALVSYFKQDSLQTSQLWQHNFFSLPAFLNNYQSLPDAFLLFTLALVSLHFLAAIFTDNRYHSSFICAQLLLLITANSELATALSPLMLSSVALIICLVIIVASHDMAYRDELTQLPSRRALNQLLLSLGRRYSIAMLDIDHFKKFNDTHGHDIGDEVLRMVASKIAKVSGGGKAFRYGGEEFTVVFPNKSPDQAEAHLESLRQSVANYAMIVRQKKRAKDEKLSKQAQAKRSRSKTKDNSLSVTISIGLAERSGKIKTPEQVLKAADEALYRAKQAGRNCTKR